MTNEINNDIIKLSSDSDILKSINKSRVFLDEYTVDNIVFHDKENERFLIRIDKTSYISLSKSHDSELYNIFINAIGEQNVENYGKRSKSK